MCNSQVIFLCLVASWESPRNLCGAKLQHAEKKPQHSDNVHKQEKKLMLVFKVTIFPYAQKRLFCLFIYTYLIFMTVPLWSHIISKAQQSFTIGNLGKSNFDHWSNYTELDIVHVLLGIVSYDIQNTANLFLKVYNIQQLLPCVFVGFPDAMNFRNCFDVFQAAWFMGTKTPPFPSFFLSPCYKAWYNNGNIAWLKSPGIKNNRGMRKSTTFPIRDHSFSGESNFLISNLLYFSCNI